eukprot:3273765-Prorocentrum_lima.AAC.1
MGGGGDGGQRRGGLGAGIGGGSTRRVQLSGLQGARGEARGSQEACDTAPAGRKFGRHQGVHPTGDPADRGTAAHGGSGQRDVERAGARLEPASTKAPPSGNRGAKGGGPRDGGAFGYHRPPA